MEEVILQKNGANFFGFERIDKDGKRHWELGVIRGNGNLRLTAKGLYFSRWISKKEIFIPLDKIRKVEVGSSHNGKWILFPIMLKVFYGEGNEIKIFGVTVGWKKAVLEWKNRIEELMRSCR